MNTENGQWNRWNQRGTLEDRYAIYLQMTDETPPKTFDEWLNGGD